MSFGTLLDELRRQRGLSKKDLADGARLSASYISLLINGGKQRPSPDVTAALAETLRLGEDEIQRFWSEAGYEKPLAVTGASTWQRRTRRQFASVVPLSES